MAGPRPGQVRAAGSPSSAGHGPQSESPIGGTVRAGWHGQSPALADEGGECVGVVVSPSTRWLLRLRLESDGYLERGIDPSILHDPCSG